MGPQLRSNGPSRIDHELLYVDQWLKGNLTTKDFVATASVADWSYSGLIWTLEPVVAGCVYVSIMGCLTHHHKLQGCAAIVTLVLALRQVRSARLKAPRSLAS